MLTDERLAALKEQAIRYSTDYQGDSHRVIYCSVDPRELLALIDEVEQARRLPPVYTFYEQPPVRTGGTYVWDGTNLVRK